MAERNFSTSGIGWLLVLGTVMGNGSREERSAGGDGNIVGMVSDLPEHEVERWSLRCALRKDSERRERRSLGERAKGADSELIKSPNSGSSRRRVAGWACQDQ